MTCACLWAIVYFTVNAALGGVYLVLLVVAMKTNVLSAVDQFHRSADVCACMFVDEKSKGSTYSITERRVPELIPVLGSQPAGDVSHKPDGRLPLLSARTPVSLATLRGLLAVSLLGEQRRDGCKQFA